MKSRNNGGSGRENRKKNSSSYFHALVEKKSKKTKINQADHSKQKSVTELRKRIFVKGQSSTCANEIKRQM